jgi:phage I-like protein
LRIFRAGVNETSKGPIVFDDAAAAAVMDAFAVRGNRLPFDYAHAMVPDSGARPEDQKAAGWFSLEVRPGPELWAVEITWTPTAAKGISDLEWLYFSPWVWTDVASGRADELINIALTNLPATYRQQELARDMRSVHLEASYGDIEAAVRAALQAKLVQTGIDYIEALYDASVVYCAAGKLYRVGYLMSGSTAVLVGEPGEVRVAYEPLVPVAAAQNISPPDEGVIVQSAERSSDMDREALVLALGLVPEASEEDIETAVKMLVASMESEKKLVALTEADSVSAAFGVVEAWQKASVDIAAARETIAQLQAEAVAKSVDEMLERGIADRKITLALQKTLREKGVQDPAWLEAHLAALPVNPALAHDPSGVTPRVAGVASDALGGKRFEDMRPVEKHRLANDNPELYRALREQSSR